MQRREPPETAAGHYVLHDFRRIAWSKWQSLSESDRERIVDEAMDFFAEIADAEGDLGCYSILGHKADLLILALRPTLSSLDTLERRLNQLELMNYTERTTSALGVTEASGYTDAAADYFDPEAEADPGIERYMETRLYPDLPDAECLSFYFMNKRRGPEQNWYDLPYEERAEHVSRHGEIGKEYAGQVTQMITGTTGFDDWEWGVTLFSEDMVDVKDLLTDMRFDPSTSRFADFGPFYVGRQFAPNDLGAFLAGEDVSMESTTGEIQTIDEQLAEIDPELSIPAGSHVVLCWSDADHDTVSEALDGLAENFDHYESHRGSTVAGTTTTVAVSAWETDRAAETARGFLEDLPGVTETTIGEVGGDDDSQPASTGDETAESVRAGLESADVYAGQPHGEDIHAIVGFTDAPREQLSAAVADLRSEFEGADAHRGTELYTTEHDGSTRRAVVSLWEDEQAAATAAEAIGTLPGVEDLGVDGEGFGTMGLFYRVKPAHREDFVSTFADVAELLEGMDGHRGTDLLVNENDENDMFIASRWASRADAMEFFRSDAFSETVAWGRDILADRPRHVFLV